jgi:hypothetical protein
MKFHQHYNEQICWDCSSLSDDYTQLTKQEAQRAFQLSDYQLKSLPYQSQDNPHNRHYHAMKLYLMKHLKSLILKKYETVEKFLEEKEEKDKVKMKRKIEALEERYKSEIMTTQGAAGGIETSSRSALSSVAGPGEEKGKKTKKKAKSSSLMIQSLVAAIKGEPT